MFTIKFESDNKKDNFETIRETIDQAQCYARNWMALWHKTEVFVTECPKLKLFEASQFEIIKETL